MPTREEEFDAFNQRMVHDDNIDTYTMMEFYDYVDKYNKPDEKPFVLGGKHNDFFHELAHKLAFASDEKWNEFWVIFKLRRII